MDIPDEVIEKIAKRVTEVLLKNLYERSRDEVTVKDICNEFLISRETLRRRAKAGLLPIPRKRAGKNYYSRHTIELANIKGIL